MNLGCEFGLTPNRGKKIIRQSLLELIGEPRCIACRLPPEEPQTRGIIRFSAYSGHPAPKDHGRHKTGFKVPDEGLICHLPEIGFATRACALPRRGQDPVPGMGEPFGPVARAQTIGGGARHADTRRRRADRTGDVEMRKECALPRLAPPVMA